MNRASRFPAVLFKKRNIFLGESPKSAMSLEKPAKIFTKKKMRERSFSFVNSNEKMLALMDRAHFLAAARFCLLTEVDLIMEFLHFFVFGMFLFLIMLRRSNRFKRYY